MSPKTEKQFKEIRESKRKLIIDTGLQLFALNGYHATTIRQIAKDAGISKGLMYNYFESKEMLLKEIFKKGLNELLVYFDRNHDGNLTVDELEFWIDNTMKAMLENIGFWRLYFSLLMQPNVMQYVQEDFLKVFNPMMQILLEYFKRQGFENPMAEMRLFFAVLDGIGMHYLIDPENFPLQESIDIIKKFYIKKQSV